MNDEIEIFRLLTEELRSRQTIEQLLALVVQRGSHLLRVPRVSAYLLDPSRTRLLVGARAGNPLHSSSVEYKLGEGLLGWIAEHGEPLRTGEAEADPRFLRRTNMVDRLGSFLGVPLISNGVCIGVLSAATRDVDYFSRHHEDLLVVLGGICAHHLEVARLSRLANG